MLLKIGVPDYPYRCMREHIAGAKIIGRRAGRDIHLNILTPFDMETMQKKFSHNGKSHIRGMPVYIAFDHKKQRVWLHPTPDGEYTLEIDRGDEKMPEKATTTLSLPKKG